MVEKPYLAKSKGIEFRNFGRKQGIQVRRRNPCLDLDRMSTESDFGFIWPNWHLFTKDDRL